MKKAILSPLFKRSIAFITGLFVVLSIVVSLFTSFTIHSILTKELTNTGLSTAKTIINSGTDMLVNKKSSLLQNLINTHNTTPHIAYIVVSDTHHRVIAHTFSPAVPTELSNTLLGLKNTQSTTLTTSNTLLNDQSVLLVSGPMVLGTVGYVHVGVDMSSIGAVIGKFIWIIQLIFCGLYGLSIFAFYFITRRATAPLSEISDYLANLSANHFSIPSSKHHIVKGLATAHGDEIGQVAQQCMTLEKELHSYITQLNANLEVKTKHKEALHIASSVQTSLLPTPDQFSDHEALDVHMQLEAGQDINGDFYEFRCFKDQYAVLAIGDVSEKGVEASLFASSVLNKLNALIDIHKDPSHIVTMLNHALCTSNQNTYFATMFLGVLDFATGRLTYVNAGHPAPILLNPSQPPTEVPYTNGFVIGIDPDFYYPSKEISLDVQDRLLLFTNGITHAHDADSNRFGTSRLLEFLSHYSDAPLEPKKTKPNVLPPTQAICAHVIHEVLDFVTGTPQSDDMAVLCISRKAHVQHIETPCRIHFKNDINELKKLRQIIELFGAKHDFSDSVLMNINLTLEEIISNTIYYGYTDHNTHLIYVELNVEDTVFTATVQDDGIAFNPISETRQMKDPTSSSHDIGGLGIHFVKNLMDEMTYDRKNNTNIIRLTKYLNPED